MDSTFKNSSLSKKNKTPWVKFWFESNQFFDWIESLEDWDRLRSAYPSFSDNDLLDSKQNVHSLKPNYGMRMEHKGTETLRDFFIKNNMTL